VSIPRLRSMTVVTAATLMLVACSSEPKDWEAAATVNTVEAYSEYLAAHPNGAHAEEAGKFRGVLAGALAWDRARGTDTEEAYAEFLEAHGDGVHADEARVRKAGFVHGYIRMNAGVNTPEGTHLQSSVFGQIESYPEGTVLSMRLHSIISEGNEVEATIDAVYVGMDGEHGRFEADDGACLLFPPSANTVIRCPDYEAPLPDMEDPAALLIYTWMSYFD